MAQVQGGAHAVTPVLSPEQQTSTAARSPRLSGPLGRSAARDRERPRPARRQDPALARASAAALGHLVRGSGRIHRRQSRLAVAGHPDAPRRGGPGRPHRRFSGDGLVRPARPHHRGRRHALCRGAVPRQRPRQGRRDDQGGVAQRRLRLEAGSRLPQALSPAHYRRGPCRPARQDDLGRTLRRGAPRHEAGRREYPRAGRCAHPACQHVRRHRRRDEARA